MNSYLRLTLITCFVCTASSPSRAELPRLLGHNFTPTTYTLAEDVVTIGTYGIGYGISDDVSISTSSWLDVSYNMPNLGIRYATDVDGFVDRFAIEPMYFKTFPYFYNDYEQESFFVRTTVAKNFSDFYVLNASLGYQYFINDRRAFSLRLEPGLSRSKHHLSLSTLHELYISQHLGVLLELGLAGLNYDTLYSQLGTSVFVRWSWGLLQLGLSRTRSLGEVDLDRWYRFDDGRIANYGEISIYHPEVQLQFYF